MRKISMFVFVGAITMAVGCFSTADDSPEEVVLDDSAALEAVDPGLSNELLRMLNGFAFGLERGDAAAVEGLLSSELLSRIAERAPGAGAEQKMRAFVLREQKKLAKNLGELRSRDELFTVTSARKLEDGKVVALTVALDGEELPKPFYFVAEDGGYKLNVVPPTTSAGSDNYRVLNGDYEYREFSCSGQSTQGIAAFPAELDVKCENTCSGWFDGTRFSTSNGSADCDYNSWGLDMTIYGNNPVCNDYC